MGDIITMCNAKLGKPPVDRSRFSEAEEAVSMAV